MADALSTLSEAVAPPPCSPSVPVWKVAKACLGLGLG